MNEISTDKKLEPGSTIPSVQVGGILSQAKGWMTFLGVLMIIAGVIQAITVVGLLICWLPIWIGILLMQAGSAAGRYSLNYENKDLLMSLDKLKNFFKITGILTIISLILSVVWIVIVIILSFMGVYDFSQYFNF